MTNIDNFIVIGFLIVTFITGILHSKGIKTIKDYALGGRNFSTSTIVATLVATWVSGSSFAIALSKTYSDGLYYVIASSGMALSFLLTAVIFIPRMGQFLGKSSIAEAMGCLYGKKVRIIISIAGILSSIGYIAVQFKVFGSLLGYFLGFTSTEAIIIAATIVVCYSAFGGIRAVTFTDVIQLFTFGVAIPIVGIMIWNHAYYEGISFVATESPNFNFSTVFNIRNPRFLEMIPLIFYFALPGLEPAFCQRILIGNNIRQVKKAFIISSVLLLFILLAMQWIPFLIFNINPNLDSNTLLSYIVDNYTYVGLKGLLVSGIVAMAMSTSDSYINAASVLFANDFCKSLNIYKNKELFISKIFSVFFGGCAIILALSEKDLLSMVLTANSFYMPIVTTPLMLSIIGFRSSAKSVLVGMVGGFVTVVIWNILQIEADCIVFAMLINLIFLIGTHYILDQPGGWVGERNKVAFSKLKQKKSQQVKHLIYKIKNINLINYCSKHFPSNELSYISLGIYIIIFTITTMYSTQTELLKKNYQIVLTFYQIMLVSGVFLFMRPIWPRTIPQNKKQIFSQCLWPLVIFFILILFNTFFVLASSFSNLQSLVFTMNLIVASILLGWKLAAVLTFLGLYLTLLFYQYYNPNYTFDTHIGSPAFVTTYVLMLLGAIIVLFLKPKQEQLEVAENTVSYLDKEVHDLGDQVTNLNYKVNHYNKTITLQEKEISRLSKTAETILNNVNHNLRLPIGNVMNFAEMLKSGLGKYSKDNLKMLTEEVYKNSTKLSTMILNMLDLAMLQVKKIQLEKSTINFSEMVISQIKVCKNIYRGKKDLKFKLDIQPELMIMVDPNYMKQTIDNLVINSINYSESGIIKIKLKKVDHHIEFSISDQGVGIPEKELVTIFEPFIVSSKTETPAGNRGVGLSLCKSAVVAHKGEIKAKSNGVNGASFIFKLPIT